MPDPTQIATDATEAFKHGDFVGAIRGFDELISLDCAGPEIHCWRALALSLSGRYREAYAGFLAALDCDPHYARALHQLAYLCACCPDADLRDGRRAVEFAKRACDASEWKEWIMVSGLAAAYAESGDYESAVRFAEMTLDMAPAEERGERMRRLEQYRAGIPHRSDAEHDLSSVRYAHE
jgi:tetratricopeptide (TPR) repeat protein